MRQEVSKINRGESHETTLEGALQAIAPPLEALGPHHGYGKRLVDNVRQETSKMRAHTDATMKQMETLGLLLKTLEQKSVTKVPVTWCNKELTTLGHITRKKMDPKDTSKLLVNVSDSIKGACSILTENYAMRSASTSSEFSEGVQSLATANVEAIRQLVTACITIPPLQGRMDVFIETLQSLQLGAEMQPEVERIIHTLEATQTYLDTYVSYVHHKIQVEYDRIQSLLGTICLNTGVYIRNLFETPTAGAATIPNEEAQWSISRELIVALENYNSMVDEINKLTGSIVRRFQMDNLEQLSMARDISYKHRVLTHAAPRERIYEILQTGELLSVSQQGDHAQHTHHFQEHLWQEGAEKDSVFSSESHIPQLHRYRNFSRTIRHCF